MKASPKTLVRVFSITVNVRKEMDVQGVTAQIHAAAHRAGANGLVEITINGESVKKTASNTEAPKAKVKSAPAKKAATAKKAPAKKAPAKKATNKKR